MTNRVENLSRPSVSTHPSGQPPSALQPQPQIDRAFHSHVRNQTPPLNRRVDRLPNPNPDPDDSIGNESDDSIRTEYLHPIPEFQEISQPEIASSQRRDQDEAGPSTEEQPSLTIPLARIKDLQGLEKKDWKNLKKGICPPLTKQQFHRFKDIVRDCQDESAQADEDFFQNIVGYPLHSFPQRSCASLQDPIDIEASNKEKKLSKRVSALFKKKNPNPPESDPITGSHASLGTDHPKQRALHAASTISNILKQLHKSGSINGSTLSFGSNGSSINSNQSGASKASKMSKIFSRLKHRRSASMDGSIGSQTDSVNSNQSSASTRSKMAKMFKRLNKRKSASIDGSTSSVESSASSMKSNRSILSRTSKAVSKIFKKKPKKTESNTPPLKLTIRSPLAKTPLLKKILLLILDKTVPL